jgi:hypothetical protein
VSIVVDSSEKKLIGWPEEKRPNSGGGGREKGNKETRKTCRHIEEIEEKKRPET